MSTASRIVDDPVDDSTDDENVINPFKVEEQETGVEDQSTGTETVEDTDNTKQIPDKLQGKSQDELADMYLNLEKELGRKNNEVGELRRLTDEYIKRQLNQPIPDTSKTVAEKKKLDVDDLLDKPEEVIDEYVANSPRLKKIEEQLALKEQEAAQAAFEKRHPDWNEVLHSNEFQTWAKESPARVQLLIQANETNDVQLATELFDLYKAIHQAKVKTAQSTAKDIRDKQLKDVKTEKKSSSEPKSGKYFRRADLIKLQMTDPERYEAMEAEIVQAYLEDRVK